MFEEEYRKEMSSLHASEDLIARTLQGMQAEQASIPLRQDSHTASTSAERFASPEYGDEARVTRLPGKRSMPLLFKIGLPAAACILLVFVGVLTIPKINESFNQNAAQRYEFQVVQQNASLAGELQFGTILEEQSDVQANSELRGLQRAESTEELLPEGILLATPVSFGTTVSVYLGYDPEQKTYFATYRKDDASEKWVVLQSVHLDEKGFIEALQQYFS